MTEQPSKPKKSAPKRGVRKKTPKPEGVLEVKPTVKVSRAKRKKVAPAAKPEEVLEKPEEKPAEVLEKKPAELVVQVKPQTPAPIAKVMSSGPIRKIRVGRGFSRRELKAVGLNVSRARLWSLSVDIRRDTERGENVDALKKWLGVGKEAPKAAAKPAKRKAPSKPRVRRKAPTPSS